MMNRNRKKIQEKLDLVDAETATTDHYSFVITINELAVIIICLVILDGPL